MNGRRNLALIRLTTTALLMALSIVFSRMPGLSFYINIGGVNLVKFSFSPIPMMVCSLINGPWYGLVCGLGTDLIGATLFPTGGAYYVGYTIDTALHGFLPGLLMKFTKNKNVKNIIVGSIMILIAAIGLYVIFPFAENFKIGSWKLELETWQKILIPLVFAAYGELILWICFFLQMKFKKKGSSFGLLDISVAFMVREFMVTPFLVSLWNYLYLSAPYAVSYFSQLMARSIVILLNVAVTFIVMIPVSRIAKPLIEDMYEKKLTPEEEEKLNLENRATLEEGIDGKKDAKALKEEKKNKDTLTDSL